MTGFQHCEAAGHVPRLRRPVGARSWGTTAGASLAAAAALDRNWAPAGLLGGGGVAAQMAPCEPGSKCATDACCTNRPDCGEVIAVWPPAGMPPVLCSTCRGPKMASSMLTVSCRRPKLTCCGTSYAEGTSMLRLQKRAPSMCTTPRIVAALCPSNEACLAYVFARAARCAVPNTYAKCHCKICKAGLISSCKCCVQKVAPANGGPLHMAACLTRGRLPVQYVLSRPESLRRSCALVSCILAAAVGCAAAEGPFAR